MKKILLMMFLTVVLLLPSKLNAQQTPMAFNLQGGYSWINGVLGAEAQFGKIGVSGGWMPCKMPISGDKISSYGGAITYYTLPAGQEGYSYYISAGIASSGYRYELASNYGYSDEAVLPMTIIMVGYKYDSGGINCKLGTGYGWCEEAGAWTFEITLGFTLFGN
jgi:hypothetical protein